MRDGFRQVFFYFLRMNVLPAGPHAIADLLRTAAVFSTQTAFKRGISACVNDGVMQSTADKRQVAFVGGIRVAYIEQR